MKKTIKNIISCVLCLIMSVSLFACDGLGEKKDPYMHAGRYQKVVDSDKFLVQAGTSQYSILLREGYDVAEEFAADEFNRLLKASTGITIPVVTQADLNSSTKYVSIGNTAMSDVANVKPTLDKYTRNGFHIKNYKEGLVINAPERSGLIYGVYRFFEKNFNYMFYDQDLYVIDKGDTFKLKNFDFQDWPDFLNRDVYSYATRMNPAYAMSLYTTGGQFSKWEEKYGEGSWWSKTLDDQSFMTALLRPRTYRDAYPEWFYSDPNSTGQEAYVQMCYTEGLYSKEESGISSFSEVTSADGSAGMFWTLVYNLINNHILVEQDKTVFLLGMSDNKAYCDCERCNEDTEKYKKSGVCVRFLNAIAKEVEKWRLENCPEREIFLSVFAYQDLTVPPVKKVNGKYEPIDDTVIVEDNIMMRYAPAYDYYLFPLMDGEHNPGSREAILGWTTLAKNIAIWDYRSAFFDSIYPFPNWLASYENIQTYKEYGILDVLAQAPSGYDGLAFLSMDNWIRARLLWDTSLNYDELVYQFTEAYYGEAGVYIREYMDYLTAYYMTDLFEQGRLAMPHYGTQVNSTYFPRQVINNIEFIFDKMYASIEKYRTTDTEKYELYKWHIECESLFYRCCQIKMYNAMYTKADLKEMINEFERIAKKANYTSFGSNVDVAEVIAKWRADLLS